MFMQVKTLIMQLKNEVKTAQTGYNWIKAWNELGFEGLKRKPESSGKSKLTENELKKLKKINKRKKIKWKPSN